MSKTFPEAAVSLPVKEHPPETVTSIADIEALVRWCVARIGAGYHPDSPAADYTAPDGSRWFSAELADRVDALHEQAFAIDPDGKIYDFGLELIRKLLERDPNEDGAANGVCTPPEQGRALDGAGGGTHGVSAPDDL